jgi:hypothetical protein
VCDQSTFDDVMLRDELGEFIDAGTVFIARDAWTPDPGGRGSAPVTHEQLLADEPDRAGGRCTQIMNIVSVTPSQQLIACCGQPLEEVPRLRLGSVAERRLEDVLNAAPPELLKMWLHVAGPREIARFVARHLPEYQIPVAATICQMCVAVQRDPRAMRIVAENAHEVVQTVAEQYARLQPHAFEPNRLATA